MKDARGALEAKGRPKGDQRATKGDQRATKGGQRATKGHQRGDPEIRIKSQKHAPDAGERAFGPRKAVMKTK